MDENFSKLLFFSVIFSILAVVAFIVINSFGGLTNLIDHLMNLRKIKM